MELDESLDALGGPRIAQPRAPEQPAAEGWTEVCPVEDFDAGARKVVYLNGQQVALFNVNGTLYALSNRCSHARGPLSEGSVEETENGCTVTCPWHYAQYDLASGLVLDGVASAPVPTYQVEVRNGVIFVGTKPRF
jgi:nitrite reductase/ring-hydroxylating ferredoxin subunit